MKIKAALWLVIFFISSNCFCQKKVSFSSKNMAGVALGMSGNYMVLQTINGISYKEWFAGLGTGIDFYGSKTIPLFLNLSANIPKTNLVIFGGGGLNFPWHNKRDSKIFYVGTSHFYTGSYSEFGIGYKIKLSRKLAVLMSTSFSYKEINNKVLPRCADNACVVNYQYYHYKYGTIQLKAGISL